MTVPTPEQLRTEVRDWLAANWTGLPKTTDPWVSSPEHIAWLERVLDAALGRERLACRGIVFAWPLEMTGASPDRAASEACAAALR